MLFILVVVMFCGRYDTATGLSLVAAKWDPVAPKRAEDNETKTKTKKTA